MSKSQKNRKADVVANNISPRYMTRLAFIELRKYVANYQAISKEIEAGKGLKLSTIIRGYCAERNRRLKRERYDLDQIDFTLIADYWDKPQHFLKKHY